MALITTWEQNAATAGLSRNLSFCQKGLADDWNDGMSNGEFLDQCGIDFRFLA